jgi:hypothetical protein
MLYIQKGNKEMIEVALRNYLEEQLSTIPVLMEYPKTPDEKFIVLQLADGGRTNYIDAATFFVTIYADSLYEAALLKEEVISLLYNSISIPAISSVTLGQDQAGTDSANHKYTYNLAFNFFYYREET